MYNNPLLARFPRTTIAGFHFPDLNCTIHLLAQVPPWVLVGSNLGFRYCISIFLCKSYAFVDIPPSPKQKDVLALLAPIAADMARFLPGPRPGQPMGSIPHSGVRLALRITPICQPDRGCYPLRGSMPPSSEGRSKHNVASIIEHYYFRGQFLPQWIEEGHPSGTNTPMLRARLAVLRGTFLDLTPGLNSALKGLVDTHHSFTTVSCNDSPILRILPPWGRLCRHGAIITTSLSTAILPYSALGPIPSSA